MAIRLQSKPNVTAPGGDYPYGNIKDNSGSADGTPLNKLVHADFHQFFAKLLDDGGVTGNDLVENSANGFQYAQALNNIIQSFVAVEAGLRAAAVSAEASTRGAADTNLQNQINDLTPTAWANIPLINGWANVSGINPQWRQAGKHIFLRGRLSGFSATADQVCPNNTFPAGLSDNVQMIAANNILPPEAVVVFVAFATRALNVDNIYGGGGTSYPSAISLDGLSFWVG